MNKKGFMFVETIVVVTILSTALIMLYSTYSGVLTNEKRRNMYDDTEYIYTTYYIADFISSLNLTDYLKKELNDKDIFAFSCNNSSLYNQSKDSIDLNETEKNKQIFCEKMINTGKNSYNVLNINRIYITKYDVSDLKSYTTKSGSITCNNKSITDKQKNTCEFLKGNLSSSMIYYLRTLDDESKYDYRIIVEYTETKTDYNDYYEKNDEACGSNYANYNSSKGIYCVKQKKLYYYATSGLEVR